jgi:hypothetical protein
VVVDRRVEREDMRTLGVEVPSLRAVEGALIDAEREYVRQKGLLPGQQSLLASRPAGNWVRDHRGKGILEPEADAGRNGYFH